MKLLIATNNSGKQVEFSKRLSQVAELVYPRDFTALDGFDPDETGQSYQENALIKARAYFEQSGGVPTLADDSGIEIEALGGQPGIHSKRFFGESSHDRINHIISVMKGQDNRKALFQTVMALVLHDGGEETFTGTISGQLALEPKGEDGFEYDLIFIPEGHLETFAQLGREVKDKIGHRGQALAQVKHFLESYQDAS